MIYHDLAQNTTEWLTARLGLVTASCFSNVVNVATGEIKSGRKKGEASKTLDTYANTLVAEMISGHGLEKFKESYWMERGKMMEPQAYSAYEIITDNKIDRGGLFTNDEMTIGASPDIRIFDASGKFVGVGEIKCPAPDTHIENLLRAAQHKCIDPDYKAQVQGQIMLSGAEFSDWFSYHPDMPPAMIRTERDNYYCEVLARSLDEFVSIVQEKIDTLEKMGVIVPPRPILEMHRQYTQHKTDKIPDFLSA